MKRLSCLPLLVMLISGLAFGQSKVPVCNGTSVGCTDYFGVANWANSPLPAGTITGYTLLAGGSGYANPWVVVTDTTGTTLTFQLAASDFGVVPGVITSITGGTGGAGYTMPQVSIVDVGVGGALPPGVPTCGGSNQPACGGGALATAVIGPPFTGGMKKFQAADTLPNRAVPGAALAGGLTVANPDTTLFSQSPAGGADYYEIALVQYKQALHSSMALTPTTLRGYVQVPPGSSGCTAALATKPSYLGPVIVAQKDRPVRVKFTNCLPTGSGGNLFIPTDTTYMGAGVGPDGVSSYTQNRATLHLHGGATPWISDGTPHQWTVPVGETSIPAALQTGLSAQNVPDMYFVNGVVVPQCNGSTITTNCSGGTAAQLPVGATNNPGQGSLTFYWTNQQGGRLMFFHDHAYGLTRLNVYAGEAAGYLLYDPAEEAALLAAGTPGTLATDTTQTTPDVNHLIPLVIQDKTFVPSLAQINATDPTWLGNFGATTAGLGDLWFPHVYVPNQNPADPTKANGFGHWDYGAWFFPPQTTLTAANPTTAVTVPCTSSAFPGQTLAPSTACPTCGCPITPNPSGTPESFMDTPVVNGVAYPVLHVAPAAYRFKILAAGNDRSWNLSWFIADPTQGSTEVAMLPANVPATGSVWPAGPGAGTPLKLCTAINPVAVPALTIGLATGFVDSSGNPLNGTGLFGSGVASGTSTSVAPCWPNYGPVQGAPPGYTMWPGDGRAGGVPDPRRAGPPWIQIGSEGGLLPAPVVIPATPVNYEQNTRSITITSVGVHGLWLGPAERADVIVDFSQVPAMCTALGVSPCTLILYNDAPTPAPAFDTRLDYFTNDGDQTPIGGAPNTPPGYGPNTRTIMQVIVDDTNANTKPFTLSGLKAAFASTATTQGVFAATQPVPVVPEAGYNSAYNANYTNTYGGISDNTMTFTPINPPLTFNQPPCAATPPATCAVMDQKAIQELFTLDYGRMNATLGHENPLTTFQNQTTVPLGYVDWPTEVIQQNQTQIWKITHNGVDTHFIHFHLFNVQVINRVGWDGSNRQPDANELGWKDTVRMNPLEDVFVALQPITPTLPFPLPDSIRPIDVTMPTGVADPNISGLDPTTGNATVTTVNNPINLGWEYVWHCHILGHEENDMMRPMIFQVAPPPPSNLVAAAGASNVTLTWTDNSASETSFTLQRSTSSAFLATDPGFASFTITSGGGFSTRGYGQTVTFVDTTAAVGTTYYYQVRANDNFLPANPNPAMFVAAPLSSAWAPFAILNKWLPAVTFIGAPASAVYGSTFTVTATTDAGVMPTITGNTVCSVGAVGGTPASATATVSMTSGTGTCTLTATWPATTTFVGTSLTQSTNALLATPTVTFTGAPANAAYNSTFNVSATTSAIPTYAPTITGTLGICSVGTVSSASPYTATVTMTSGTGTCTLTASWLATSNYAARSATQSTTATKIASTTTITSMVPTSSVAGQGVVVSVNATGAGVAPSGNVTVNGTGAVTCNTTLSAGAGSCTLTFTSAGAKTVTATYNGDTNYNTSSSTSATEQVRDFSFTTKQASQTVNGNQNAKYTVNVTSLNGLTGTVSLTCAPSAPKPYPSSFSCSVSPATVTLTGGNGTNATYTVGTVAGVPGTYNLTFTATFGSGSPSTGGLTHTIAATVTTKN